MRYLSPATLLGSPVTDKKSLALQKKMLLAHLELSGDGQLTTGEHTLSKNDLLEYFEALENETIFSYHQAISTDKTLVVFLQTSRMPGDASFLRNDLYSDPGFLQWVSPYFFTALTQDVSYCLQNTAETELQDLLKNPQLLTEYDRERAWITIAQLLESNIAVLESCEKEARRKKTRPDPEQVTPLISTPLIRMILLLPKEPFTRVRDNYAFTTMQLSIIQFNKHRWNRDLAKAWINKAKTLAVSAAMSNQVAAKAHEMENIRKKSERNMGIRVAVIFGIIILRMLLGEKGCNAPAASSTQHVYTKLTNTPCATCPPHGSSTVRYR